MTSQLPVDIPSDPDDGEYATAYPSPPVLSKRSHASTATTSSSDFLAAFSPSPPLPKRRPPASPILLLDDTPSPPKRPQTSAPLPPPSVVADTPQSFVAKTPNSVVPCSLGFGTVVPETPGSVLPCSFSSDIVLSKNPGLLARCSGGGRDAGGLSCAASLRKLSGVSCLISLESDDDVEDSGCRKPVKLPSNTIHPEPVVLSRTSSCSDKLDSPTGRNQKDYSRSSVPQRTFSGCKNGGTNNFEQPLNADLPSEDSALQRADVFTEKHGLQDERHSEVESTDRETTSFSKRERNSARAAARKRRENEDKAQVIEKRKRKQQEEKEWQKEENVRQIEEKKKKQQEEKKLKKEEKARLIEERKQKRQENKLQKEAMKAQLVEMKKLEKEKRKWEAGKLSLKSIVAEIDSKVIESGSIGGHLLSRFADKGLSFRVTTNPIGCSILWKMNVPDQIAQHQASGSEVPYIIIVYQAEEFCDLVSSGLFFDHVHKVQRQYPTFTICYVTNKLTSYIKKCEQTQYKNPSNSNTWTRPPVEEVLCKLTTHYAKIRSRQCTDEAELAEHVVGLTSSLANCQFRKKLTWLSVHANGSIIPQGFIDKDLIKKNTWLKALISIPKVQPRHALAIWKKYPTMRSLLNVYMDPTKTVHEKEFLLEDLRVEGLLGNEDRRLGEVCSKRVYRILMAQNGGMKTDDVENGADFFGV